MARAGQVTVTTTGTAVQCTNQPGYRFALTAHPDNTDTIWVGNDDAGDVSSSNGFPLSPGATVDPGSILEIIVSNLNELWVDADVGGEKLCWIRLN